MIHSARPTVPPVAIIIFTQVCFGLRYFKNCRDERTDGNACKNNDPCRQWLWVGRVDQKKIAMIAPNHHHHHQRSQQNQARGEPLSEWNREELFVTQIHSCSNSPDAAQQIHLKFVAKGEEKICEKLIQIKC